MARVVHRRTGDRPFRLAVAFLFLASGLASTVAAPLPAAAAVTAVKGYACGYYTNVGLFGGPQAKLGCEPQIGTPNVTPTAQSLSPSVSLPAGGSTTPITVTDLDGAQARYGPATIFGGIWPLDVASATPSGPITVSTQGTTGAGGSVTSSARIGLHATPKPVQCDGGEPGTTNCLDPGGFGPPPVWGDDILVQCSANESSVSGSTTFTNSFIATATDRYGAPLPAYTFPIPTNPPPNYTIGGVISNVGDVFTAVFNEHVMNPDGSLTVNGVHMYLFGETAVGDMVKGQATCGTTPAAPGAADTQAPYCGIPIVLQQSPDVPVPKVPRQELVGVFDTGGLQSVTNVRVVNGTVRTGILPNNDSNPANDYLTFIPGQKGPLSMVATRTNESLPMTWSFDVTDAAGNLRHCVGSVSSVGGVVDFDNDADADIGVFRSSSGVWYIQNPATSTPFGVSGDIPVPGDYDGDGDFDVAVYRPTTGVWYVQSPATATVFGVNGDIPVPGDYDGNGTSDRAVFRPSNGVWYIQSTGASIAFGVSGDIPVPGDYDGDGDTDIAVYRPSNGVWYIRSTGTSTLFGVGGDIPVPGDYNGDGKTDIAVFRPSNGVWYVQNPASSTPFGASGDIPVPADYNGDGKTDVAVFRPSNGVWYIQNPPTSTPFGASGDIPLPLPAAIRTAFFA